jgi:hypothetical protein
LRPLRERGNEGILREILGTAHIARYARETADQFG